MNYDKELDNLAIYLTSFAFQNDPKLIHDEIVHKTSALLRRVEVDTAKRIRKLGKDHGVNNYVPQSLITNFIKELERGDK